MGGLNHRRKAGTDQIRICQADDIDLVGQQRLRDFQYIRRRIDPQCQQIVPGFLGRVYQQAMIENRVDLGGREDGAHAFGLRDQLVQNGHHRGHVVGSVASRQVCQVCFIAGANTGRKRICHHRKDDWGSLGSLNATLEGLRRNREQQICTIGKCGVHHAIQCRHVSLCIGGF